MTEQSQDSQGSQKINLVDAAFDCVVSRGMGAQEALKAVEGFAGDLAQLSKRWDDFFSPEKVKSFGEAYLDARFEIILYGDGIAFGAEKLDWFARITPHTAIFHDVGADPHVDVVDISNTDGGQDEVVLINVVELCDRPEVKVPISVRAYLAPKQRQYVSAGNGLLYALKPGPGFKVFPLLGKRKVYESIGDAGLTHSFRRDVIQSGAEAVNGVTNDERERFRNWFFGYEGRLENIRLCLSDDRISLIDNDFIERSIKGFRPASEFINMAIGPLDL